MSDEERLQTLLAEIRLLEGYAAQLESREDLVVRAIMENRAAQEALKSLSEETRSEILVHIGGGLFVRSEAPPVQNLLVTVGAGVTLQKTKRDAEAFVEERMKDLQQAVKSLEQQRAELGARLNASRNAVNEIVQRAAQRQA
jgi:prefoldin alpha subunit